MASRKASARIATEALLLRRVEYGEADLVLTLLTLKLGKVSVLARGARKSSKRFGSALEPMHTLAVELDERPGAELFTLLEAKLHVPRAAILGSLAAMEAAGKALGWVRRAAPPRTPEPAPYALLTTLLDRLSAAGSAEACGVALAEAGLPLLTELGWGIDFERCVRCGRQALPAQSASVDAARGGLICRSCGGARLRLSAEARQRMAQVATGTTGLLTPEDAPVALKLVEAALGAHAGIE
ncbi:MAG: recombination and repair protein RecO [Polyangiaceae bacterium]|nr:recombination and repair protein RecO [Polyangiaceae bacterium]